MRLIPIEQRTRVKIVETDFAPDGQEDAFLLVDISTVHESPNPIPGVFFVVLGIEVTSVINILYGGREEGVSL